MSVLMLANMGLGVVLGSARSRRVMAPTSLLLSLDSRRGCGVLRGGGAAWSSRRFSGGFPLALFGCSGDSGGDILVLGGGVEHRCFPTAVKCSPVVPFFTVAGLESLYAGGMVHGSVTVRVGFASSFDRRLSMVARGASSLCNSSTFLPLCYLRAKAMAFVFGVEPFGVLVVLSLWTPEMEHNGSDYCSLVLEDFEWFGGSPVKLLIVMVLLLGLNGQGVAVIQPGSCIVLCGFGGCLAWSQEGSKRSRDPATSGVFPGNADSRGNNAKPHNSRCLAPTVEKENRLSSDFSGRVSLGLMVSAYLVYGGMTAEEALEMYASRRTTNNNGVSIPSQRRYVKYWSHLLGKGIGNGPPEVRLPQEHSRELLRIRLYDTANVDSVFFVVSELQEVPNEMYRPSVELARGCCRQFKKGYCRSSSPRYYISHINCDSEEDEVLTEGEEPRLVVQMDTESSIIDEKTCLDFYFDKPVRVSGDIRITFYQKMIGSRLFYTCFNTAFITNGLLQFSIGELDKVGGNGRSISGPDFSLELLFSPATSISGKLLSRDDLSLS
ncbi:hypothetical protein DY000_02033553 [Brassica cretica]|uniref:C2 tensin-type domain-containing protein n=1 Tax=Brassica cretica TaxID=69181 RepID=A0ABQ7DKH2_BRACR|nr:hypothetical protein DY000_02033553 [Brassica cretica]